MNKQPDKTNLANKPSISNPQSPTPRLASLLLTPLLGYILISLIVTWPLITHLQGWVPGLGDWGQNLWALWWTRQSLLTLAQSPFFTHHLFHPEGVTLLFHPLDVSDGLLAMPLYGLLGGDVTYNVMVLLSFVLGGWGTYLLALHLTRHRAASFVAGLIFVLSPYHFLRIDLGHLNLSTLQWIPFYVLFLLEFIQRGSKRSAGLAIFFLVFNALNSWYYVIYCGLLSLAIVFWPRLKECGLKSALLRLGRIILILTIALIFLSPLLLPMFQLLSTTTLIGEHNPLRHSVDLFSFWLPGPPSTWAGWFEDVWISYAAQNREPGASAYVGYTVLGLSIMGLVSRRRRRQAVWWLAVALGFTLLAMGPQLQIDGQILDIPLPYQLPGNLIPAFSITGIPGRFVVMTSLALAMLAAYGLATLAEWLSPLPRSSACPIPRRAQAGRLRSVKPPHKGTARSISGSKFLALRGSMTPERRSQTGSEQNKLDLLSMGVPLLRRPTTYLYLAAAFLVTLEYLALPLRLTPTGLDDFYHTMAADTESYAVLDIKWDANFLMHAQTVHNKPLAGGWLARLPESQATYLNQGSLDKAFLYLLLGPEGTTLTDPAIIQPVIQTALAERNIRYIIDHDNVAGPWLEQFAGWPVVYEGDGVVVYGAERQ